MRTSAALRILLIEDNELDARMMAKSLRAHPETDFEVTRVADLAGGMTLLAETAFDCVLLDLSLPDSEGLVSVELLSARVPECPIVVLTGLDDPSTAVEAVRHGAQDYLSKQAVDSSTVARSIRYAVARHNGDLALRSATEQIGLMRDRERIARDLHDTVIQQLFAIGLGLSSVTASVTDAEVRIRLQRAVEGIDSAIHQLRETIFGLNTVPPEVALSRTVNAVVDDAAEGLGFRPIVEVGPMPADLPPTVRHEVSQVLTEALSNTAKHAEATAATVSLHIHSVGDPAGDSMWESDWDADRKQDWLVMTITDNGRGLDDRRRDIGGSGLTGRGLVNMERRAREQDGECFVGPGPGGGTRIEWRVPLAS